jgi:hypothetical protein
MASSLLLYAAFAVAAAGIVSIVVPLRWLGIRNRWVAAGLAVAGLVTASSVLTWPAPSLSVDARQSALDEFAPVFQFVERHAIPVRATPIQIYGALKTVSADEIPLYRELVWVRRGGNEGPESILNPPDSVPLIAVATRTSFITLADVPGVEYVMGTVVIAPPGVRLALGSTPESFKELTLPGFAKATMGFRIEPRADGWCLVRAETRVDATDYVSRATFARYWRVIAPGTTLVHNMWLRAVKVRAETIASAPPVGHADWDWIDRLGRERREPVEEEQSPVRIRR